MLIICNGMLRSGSTLQYNLAAAVMERHCSLVRAGFIGGFADPRVVARLAAMRDSQDWHIVKTHEPPLEHAFYNGRVRTLFSRRDPRDIAASIRKKWDKPFAEILSDIADMAEIGQQTMALPDALVQEYSDLYENLEGCVAQLGRFLSVPLSPAEVSAIAAEHAVEKVAERLQQRRTNPLFNALRLISARHRIDPKTQMHDDHISPSRGRDGDWRNCFSAQEIEMLHAACDAHSGMARKTG
jgi:hypothetical protein